MTKYYIVLLLCAGAALFYVFTKDPCNQAIRADFAGRYPDYEILDSGAGEGEGLGAGAACLVPGTTDAVTGFLADGGVIG